MITRPLELASRLRPPPRSFDVLFYVNVGLLVLLFVLFGSRFVLAPGLGVNFRLPTAAGVNANAKLPTHFIDVLATGQIFTPQGVRKIEEMDAWFAEQAKGTKEPLLLVRGDALVTSSVMAQISSAATRAGFVDVIWAAGETPDRARGGGR